MLVNQIFYHAITRKIIVAFGSLFSDVKVVRKSIDDTCEFIGSISGTTLTLTSLSSGQLRIGDAIEGSDIAEGTKITAFIAGRGSVGTYQLNISQNISSRALKSYSQQTISVPIAYAPKEKWLVRIEQDPNLTNHTYISLPRMSFEITGMAYDPSRKTNRASTITCGGDGGVSRMFSPVPYNIDMSLYVLSKTQEDALQIVEQILPYFSPEFTMSVKAVPESNVIVDVPIILNSLSVQDDYDGDFQTRRFVTYTLNFTLKTMMFGPSSDGKVIKNITVNADNGSETSRQIITSLEMLGDENTGNITQTWNQS